MYSANQDSVYNSCCIVLQHDVTDHSSGMPLAMADPVHTSSCVTVVGVLAVAVHAQVAGGCGSQWLQPELNHCARLCPSL